MKLKHNLAAAMMLLTFAGCAAQPVATTTPEPQPTPEPPKTKTYTNEQYGFSLEYPVSWQIKENTDTGVIISAGDENDEWGGTNLNMNFQYKDGDYGMGTKEVKKDQISNSNGVKFDLVFNEQDEEFNKTYDVKSDPTFRSVDIGTDFIPGLVVFSYHTDVNPAALDQLKDILISVKKL